MKNKILHIFLFVFFLLFLTSCDFFGSTTEATTTTQVTTTEEITTEPATTDSVTTKSDLTLQLEYIYNLAVEAEAFDGTYEEWLESVTGPQGEPGCQVLLRVAEGYVQWQYEGDLSWSNLILLADLVGPTGPSGTDGQEVDFQVSGDHIQWKYTDDTEWTNLLSITELIGPAGVAGREPTLRVSEGFLQWTYINDPEWYNLIEIASLVGTSGEDGVDGEDGREVILQVAEGYIQWQYTGDETWTNLIDLATLTGADGTNGTDGVDGVDGREVFFQVAEGYIQWQYYGDTTWSNLIDLATLTGTDGTNGTDGIDGVDGREVLFQVANGYIQWQYLGDMTWTNLIDLVTLTGADGTNGADGVDGVDGREVLFQVSGGYIQWQYSGDTTWTNLIDLATLTGADGTNGIDGIDGREVLFQVAEGYIQWQYSGDTTWTNLIDLATLTGADGTNGTDGIDGVDGREVLFQVSSGYIQWQYSGDTTWTNLIDLATLTGADGTNGTDGVDGVDGREVLFQVSSGYIQWQYFGDVTWSNLIDLATLTGTDGTNGTDGIDGREVSFQVANGYIQWKYSGDSSWTNLIDLATLTGADGTNGIDGTNGTDGIDGREVLFQVANGYIQWQYTGESTWTNLIEVATLVGDTGEDGVGISSMEINELGELVVTFTDATTQNLGKVVNTYTVIFKDYNNYIIDVQIIIYGEDATTPTDPTRNGYTFTGWNGTYTNITSDVTLLALYTVNTYTVEFDSAGGSEITTLTDIPYGSTISLSIPDKEGYYFAGWFVGTTINDSQFTSNDTINNNITLYARWEEAGYIVNFVDYDATVLLTQRVTFGFSATAPDNPTREGYVFDSWDVSFMQVSSNLTVTALYIPIDYTVTFDSNGGTLVEDYIAGYETDLPELSNPIKVGHDFIGWFIDSELLTPYSQTTMPLDGMTLYAKWELSTYQIIFNTVGGDPITSIEVTYGTVINSVPNATKLDCVFSGWQLNDSDFNLPYTYLVESDITLVASWIGLESGIMYELIGEEVTITGYSGSATDLIIPDTISGYPVTTIAENAFKENTTIVTLTFGQYINAIEDNAFMNMTNLQTIELPASAVNFGTFVFYGANSLQTMILSSEMALELRYLFGDNINYVPDSLSKIKYANGSAYIDKTLLSANLNGVTIELADDCTAIADNQFMDLVYITEVIIPEGVISIGANAFRNTNITSITLPNTLETIGNTAFYSTDYLTNITLPNSLTDISGYAFQYSGLTSITIPSSVINIGVSAFQYCFDLVSVTFEENSQLEIINTYTFDHCENLPSIEIPASVIKIDDRAFYYCYELTELTFESGSNLLYIEEQAFDKTDLRTIILPNGLLYIDGDAFDENYNIEEIFIPSSVTNISSYAFDNAPRGLLIYTDCLSKPVGWGISNEYNWEYIFGYIETIDNGEFIYATTILNESIILGLSPSNTSTEIVFPSTFGSFELNRFAINSFAYNEQITSITIPNNILRIGKYAFYNMPNLANITFENLSQLQKIDYYAFYNCDSLTNLTIPDNVLVIEAGAFYHCENLATLTFGQYSQVDTIEYNAFSYTALTEVYLPDTLVNCSSNSFYQNREIKLFTSFETQPVGWVGEFENDFYTIVWGYIETIDNDEFIYATTTIGEAVLLGISDSNTNTEIVVPSSIGAFTVNRIPRGLFYQNLEIVSVFIPNSIQTIAGYSFYNVPNMHTVIFEEGIQIDSIESNAFYACASLKNIIIPNTVTLIEEYAFASSGVEGIIIPNNVITIEEYAFQNCSSLYSLYFEKESSVYEIGFHAFYATKLRNVVIPLSVTTIGERAFYSGDVDYLNYRINIYSEADSIPSGWDSQYSYLPNEYWNIAYYGKIDNVSFIINSENQVSIIGFAPDYSSTDIVIPNLINDLPVYNISSLAFYRNDNISSIYISNSVTSIGDLTFSFCNSLQIVEIEEGSQLLTIGKYAFYYCKELLNIELENALNLNLIDQYAFNHCESLTTIIIPIIINTINNDVFYSNYSMIMIYAEAESKPEGWASDWKSVTYPVTWGYTDFYQSTITFETNGGNTIDPIKLDEGLTITQPDDPTKEGYTFSGWYLDSEFIDAYVFDVMPVDNFTVYAKWTINTYSITYKDYDGTVLQTGDYDYGVDISGVTIPTEPTRIGYTFIDWDGTLPSTMPSNDIVITALYSINTYSITYKDYDGTVLNTYYFDYNEEITLTPPTNPTRGGYTFTGWDTTLPTNMPANDIIVTATYTVNQYSLTFKDWDGTVLQTAIYDFEEDLSGVTAPTDPTRIGYTFTGWDKSIPTTMRDYDYIITAQYTINEYTISFDSNDGTAVTAIVQNYDTDVTQPADPTKLGSIFDGWYTDDETFLIEYTFTTMPAEDITLYAKWIVVSYKLQYVDYDDTVIQLELYEYGDDLSGVTAPTDPTRTGYTFNGWDISVPATMPASDVTITATYTINNYFLVYKDYDGTVLQTALLYPYNADLSSAPAPSDPTRIGYTFSGWDTSVPANMPANDVIITATYTINQYSIEFVDWDSTVLQTADYDYGASLSGVTAPSDPTRTGYTFNSWDSSIPATMPLDGVTITATYDINEYTISFNSNGGTAVTSITQNYNTSVTAPSSPTKDGYTFDGWYSDELLTSAYTFTTMPAENITLYAKWTCYLSYSMKGDSTYEITGLVGTPSNVVIPRVIDGVAVTSIADDAFTSCTSIVNIVIADSITTIGSYVFNGCDNLATVYIPDSVVTMGGYVFIYIDTATINCEAVSEPAGWDSNWDFWCGSTINWGQTQ
ncbi:leucine-rich repeat protein [Candidatus Izemoplasma sp. B36]|uniref:leucine-rich repeat protein n=1 Tax=Candidatus Izemoplasma sp. B36 TaxID=3242468 RepID=UPI003556017C